jgi:hypothetical protein
MGHFQRIPDILKRHSRRENEVPEKDAFPVDAQRN